MKSVLRISVLGILLLSAYSATVDPDQAGPQLDRSLNNSNRKLPMTITPEPYSATVDPDQAGPELDRSLNNSNRKLPTTITPEPPAYDDKKISSEDIVNPSMSSQNHAGNPNVRPEVNILGAKTAFLFHGLVPGGEENNTGNAKETDDSTTILPDVENKTNTVVVPDPYERYVNRIWLEGRREAVETDMESMLHSALWNTHVFQRIEPLRVHVVHTQFRQVYSGDSVTEIHYVVTYDGQIMEAYKVQRTLTAPAATQTIQHGLDARHMKQYKGHKLRHHEHSWAHRHQAILIVMSCVLSLLVVVLIVAIFAKRRNTKKAHRANKGPVVTADRSCDKKKLFADDTPPPYSMDNPLYQFETNAVMDGQTIP